MRVIGRMALLCLFATPMANLQAADGGAQMDTAGSTDATAQFIVSKVKEPKGLGLLIGCAEAQLAVAIAKKTSLRIECVDADEARVNTAREYIAKAGLYGTHAAADAEASDTLNYPKNCFNLVLHAGVPSEKTLAEIFRVLSPKGVALIFQRDTGIASQSQIAAGMKTALAGAGIKKFEVVNNNGAWAIISKEYESGWDEWTHRGHDEGNSFTSRDTIDGAAFKPQWIADYRPGLASGAVALAGGRVVVASLGYEDAPELTPYIQVLDAFTGIEQWSRVGKKELPISRPAGMYSNRESCSDIAVVKDTLYLLAGKFCQVFDLKTGTLVSSLAVPETAVAADVWLYLSCDGKHLFGGAGKSPSSKISWDSMHYRGVCKNVFALSLESGKLLWVGKTPAVTCSLCVGEGKLFFFDEKLGMHALDCNTGTEAWSVSPGFAAGSELAGTACYAGKLWALYNPPFENPDNPGEIFKGPALLTMARNNRLLEAFDPKSGEHLFKCDFSSEIAGFAFCGTRVLGTRQHGVSEGGSAGMSFADANTGKLVWTEPGSLKTRCTPTVATANLILRRGNGPNQVIQTKSILENAPVVTNFIGFRSSCSYPAIPAYGMLFVQGEGCACRTPIRGNIAMTPGDAELNLISQGISPEMKGQTERIVSPFISRLLKKGDAFGQPVNQTPPVESSPKNEKNADSIPWQTWRADAMRSGSTPEIPELPLRKVWSQIFPGRVTPVAIARGKVLAGSTSRVMAAFDLETGKKSWDYIAPGEITVSPYLWEGRVFFSDGEGWAHCLRIDDGAEIWSYRASLGTERMIAYGSLVSRWPAWAGVVVKDAVAYIPSGFFPDEQTAVTALDAATGATKWQELIDCREGGFRGGFVPKGEMVLANDRLYIPTGVGQPWFVPLKTREHHPMPAFDSTSEIGVKAEQIMAIGTDLVAVAPDLRYTQHVNAPRGKSERLPVVSENSIFLLNEKAGLKGPCLVSAKREMFNYKVSFDYATFELKKENRGKFASDYLHWSAWPGKSMTTLIKAGGILFSGGSAGVFATDAASGNELWSADITGTVTDIAFSAGYLVVVTDQSEIIVFTH